MSRADRLRAIALERVAEGLGYRRDRHDRTRWKRPGSVISISGTQFYDHVLGRGGGGAIDLAIHASGLPFRAALDLLERIAPACAGGYSRTVCRRFGALVKGGLPSVRTGWD